MECQFCENYPQIEGEKCIAGWRPVKTCEHANRCYHYKYTGDSKLSKAIVAKYLSSLPKQVVGITGMDRQIAFFLIDICIGEPGVEESISDFIDEALSKLGACGPAVDWRSRKVGKNG